MYAIIYLAGLIVLVKTMRPPCFPGLSVSPARQAGMLSGGLSWHRAASSMISPRWEKA